MFQCISIFCDGSYSCYCPPSKEYIDVVKLLAPYSCHVHRMPCHVDIYTCCKFLEEFPWYHRFGSFYENIYYDFLSSLEYEKIITDERRNRKFAKREKRKTKTKAKKSENKPGQNSGRKTINENSTRKIKHYDSKTMELLNFL